MLFPAERTLNHHNVTFYKVRSKTKMSLDQTFKRNIFSVVDEVRILLDCGWDEKFDPNFMKELKK